MTDIILQASIPVGIYGPRCYIARLTGCNRMWIFEREFLHLKFIKRGNFYIKEYKVDQPGLYLVRDTGVFPKKIANYYLVEREGTGFKSRPYQEHEAHFLCRMMDKKRKCGRRNFEQALRELYPTPKDLTWEGQLENFLQKYI